jgi:hypothetical protein
MNSEEMEMSSKDLKTTVLWQLSKVQETIDK